MFVAVGLTFAWMGMWAAYIFAGQLTPVEPEAFKLVPSLDITIMVRALAFGGVLLWRRNAWGYIVAANAGGDHHRRDSSVGGKRAGRVGTADLTAPPQHERNEWQGAIPVRGAEASEKTSTSG